MEFAELSTFVKIVELGSLSGAARATGQSLPTVSRQLRSLELELDSELALRTTRRLTVTEAGQRLYEHARRALNELERAKSGAGARASEKLVLSVPVTLGQWLVVPQLAKLLTSRPGLRLEVRLEDRLTELLAENVDVVVRAGLTPPDSPDLIAQPLFSFHRSWSLLRATSRRTVRPRRLRDWPITSASCNSPSPAAPTAFGCRPRMKSGWSTSRGVWRRAPRRPCTKAPARGWG